MDAGLKCRHAGCSTVMLPEVASVHSLAEIARKEKVRVVGLNPHYLIEHILCRSCATAEKKKGMQIYPFLQSLEFLKRKQAASLRSRFAARNHELAVV